MDYVWAFPLPAIEVILFVENYGMLSLYKDKELGEEKVRLNILKFRDRK